MILIGPDYDRRIDIPGVPAPVRRPVDIDQAATGFTNLRTLRIYRFDSGSVIEGHAEEDEVFLVVLAGSIELTMIVDLSEGCLGPMTLSAPTAADSVACAAYLPPHASYKLVALGDADVADVAYARARATGGRSPKIFSSSAPALPSDCAVVLEESLYAECLRFRLVRFRAQQSDIAFTPIHASEAVCESLVHIGATRPAKGVATFLASEAAPVWLDSWDTVAVAPGERLTFNLVSGSSGLVLVVMAA